MKRARGVITASCLVNRFAAIMFLWKGKVTMRKKNCQLVFILCICFSSWSNWSQIDYNFHRRTPYLSNTSLHSSRHLIMRTLMPPSLHVVAHSARWPRHVICWHVSIVSQVKKFFKHPCWISFLTTFEVSYVVVLTGCA